MLEKRRHKAAAKNKFLRRIDKFKDKALSQRRLQLLSFNSSILALSACNEESTNLMIGSESQTANQNLTTANQVLAPGVAGVTSSSTNTFHEAGDEIPILVSFDEDVFVTGTPTLELETGETDAIVSYDQEATLAYAVSAYYSKCTLRSYK